MISVCIPTYNGEKFLKQQLDSIISQLNEDDEVIISDDSSSDRTIEIIKNYNDKRIVLIEDCKFKSPIFNLENALKISKGDYIFFADQDDVWITGKIEKMVSYLKEYDLVVSDCSLIDENNRIIKESFFKEVNSKKGFIHNLLKNGYLGCCIAIKKDIKDKVLPFPKSIAMHDIWIGLLTEVIGKTYFLPEVLILYRKHQQNATPFTSGKSNNPIWFRIRYRLVMLFEIFKRVLSLRLSPHAH